jgi:tRNA (mo5U34)-methyltransferase
MTGLRVADVGCSNGFFSYEFERRGAAEVVAVGLASWLDHDWSPRKRREYAGYTPQQVKELDDGMFRASFDLVGRELGSKRVRKVESTIYDLSPERVGTFDLVFCAAMLMHVRDPVLGVHALRSICEPEGAQVISISTIAADDPRPIAQFAGEWNQCNFWQMNPACLKKLLRCCDFEPTGEEVVFDEALSDGSWRDKLFACRARPRPG